MCCGEITTSLQKKKTKFLASEVLNILNKATTLHENLFNGNYQMMCIYNPYTVFIGRFCLNGPNPLIGQKCHLCEIIQTAAFSITRICVSYTSNKSLA